MLPTWVSEAGRTTPVSDLALPIRGQGLPISVERGMRAGQRSGPREAAEVSSVSHPCATAPAARRDRVSVRGQGWARVCRSRG